PGPEGRAGEVVEPLGTLDAQHSHVRRPYTGPRARRGRGLRPAPSGRDVGAVGLAPAVVVAGGGGDGGAVLAALVLVGASHRRHLRAVGALGRAGRLVVLHALLDGRLLSVLVEVVGLLGALRLVEDRVLDLVELVEVVGDLDRTGGQVLPGVRLGDAQAPLGRLGRRAGGGRHPAGGGGAGTCGRGDPLGQRVGRLPAWSTAACQ